MEIDILNAIQTLRNPVFDVMMPIISHIGNGVLAIVLSIVLMVCKKTRKIGIALTLALILEFTVGGLILKPLIARQRPFTVNTAIQLIIAKPTDLSFPSGHTSAAFSMVFTLLFLKNKWWIPMCVLATCIAFSRMYLYVHYPTDILGGFIVGLVAAYVVVKGMEWYENRKSSTIQ